MIHFLQPPTQALDIHVPTSVAIAERTPESFASCSSTTSQRQNACSTSHRLDMLSTLGLVPFSRTLRSIRSAPGGQPTLPTPEMHQSRLEVPTVFAAKARRVGLFSERRDVKAFMPSPVGAESRRASHALSAMLGSICTEARFPGIRVRAFGGFSCSLLLRRRLVFYDPLGRVLHIRKRARGATQHHARIQPQGSLRSPPRTRWALQSPKSYCDRANHRLSSLLASMAAT